MFGRSKRDRGDADRNLLSPGRRRERRATGAAFVVVAFLLALGTPARAASVTSLDFVAGAEPANGFLVESSRLAAASAGPRVAAFARRELAGRERVIADFIDWAAAERQEARAADLAPSLEMLGRFFGPTDRSIEITRVPDRAPILQQLSTLGGQPFDALYVSSQTNALTRLVGYYVDFIQNGDDETLRALAVHDLPRVRHLLAEIEHLK